MELEQVCNEIRADTLRCIAAAGEGHAGGALSIVELLAVLYFRVMAIDPSHPQKEDRDRLVVSKGHAGPAVYAALANRGYFSKALLDTLNQPGTSLPSHCDMRRTPGIDMTAGSLGQGFSCAVGIATANRLKRNGAWTYAILGDGECQEGQIWEAAMFAGNQKLDHLMGFVDCNGQQIDGPTAQVNGLEPLAEKWRSFGWNVQEVENGHDTAQLERAILRAKAMPGRPAMLLLHTIKGKGVPFVEELGTASHYCTVTPEQAREAARQLRRGEGCG